MISFSYSTLSHRFLTHWRIKPNLLTTDNRAHKIWTLPSFHILSFFSLPTSSALTIMDFSLHHRLFITPWIQLAISILGDFIPKIFSCQETNLKVIYSSLYSNIALAVVFFHTNYLIWKLILFTYLVFFFYISNTDIIFYIFIYLFAKALTLK